MRTWMMAAAVVALAPPALAGGQQASGRLAKLVVEPAALAKDLGAGSRRDGDLVILQVGDKAGYAAGHIPGARLVALAELAAPMGGEALTLELPTPEALRAKLVELGVSNRSRIVVVPTPDGIQSATRVVFTLQAAGLGERTRLLDGGTAAWAAAGLALSKDTPSAATPGKLAALRYRPLVVDAAFVKAHLSAPGYVVIDARAPDFYSGARAGGSAARPHKAGHIEGAKSVFFGAVTTPDLKLAPQAEIAQRFKDAGVKAGDTVIVYCHVGQQASATLLAAESLGIKARLYDGSFEEWSRLGGAVAAR